MSRLHPQGINPVTKFLTWSGSRGCLTYYDKEKDENIDLPLPFEFMVVDQLSTITGFSDEYQSGYWSNEVRKISTEKLTVRTTKGPCQTGLYKDLTDVRSKGAKYAKSIYIVYRDGEDYILANIKAAGACLTAWIDFTRNHNVDNGKVKLIDTAEAKKGATKYYVPIFEWSPAGTEEDTAAIKLAKDLETYLDQYLAPRPNVYNPYLPTTEPVTDDTPPLTDDDAPFDGEDASLSEIPF